MEGQYIKQNMCLQVVGKMNIPYDKSAVKEYYMNEGEQSPVVSDDRINPSVQVSEPQLHPVLDDHLQTSTQKGLFIPRIPPRILAFCGGGSLCVAHIGILKSLKKHGLLSSVKECIGVSAGCIISLLYILGYTLTEIEKLTLSIDFSIFVPSFEPERVLSFFNEWGFDKGDKVERLISSLLVNKGLTPDITFSDFAKKYPIKLRCYATEIQSAKIKEFSVKHTPNSTLLFAIRSSMSVPMLFTPPRDPLTGMLYMDGGIIHNMPIVILSPSEIKHTLCCFFDVTHTCLENPAEITGFDICKSIYSSFTSHRNNAFIKKYPENILVLPLYGYTAVGFETKEISRKLITIGENICDIFLSGRPSVRIPRRYSVA